MTHAENNIDIHPQSNISRGPGRPPGSPNKPKIEPIDTSTNGVAAAELNLQTTGSDVVVPLPDKLPRAGEMSAILSGLAAAAETIREAEGRAQRK